MIRRFKIRVLMSVVVGTAVAMVMERARAAEPSTAELLQKIEQLEDNVGELRSKVAELENRPVNQTDVDATVAQVLSDAEERSRLMQVEGFTAGYSKGAFVIQSADGNFRLQPFLNYQVRHNTTWREDGKALSAGGSSDDDIQNGWELRRLKFGFKGNAFSPKLTYSLLWATGRRDGTVTLEEGWVQYAFATDWSVRLGQFKAPLYKESLVSSTRLLAAERSMLADQLFGADNFVQGVSLNYSPAGPVRATVSYNDGFASANTNYQDPGTSVNTRPNNTTNFGFTGRTEYLVFGDWKAADDFTSVGVKTDTLVLGAAVDATQSGDTTAYRHTADLTYKLSGGLSLFASFGGNYSTDVATGTGAAAVVDDTYTWGGVAQVSYLIPDTKWEPFGRYTFIALDDPSASPAQGDQLSEITVGVNYYFAGQSAKVTVDLGYLPEGSPTSADGAAVLQNEGAEFYLRAQFQLLL